MTDTAKEVEITPPKKNYKSLGQAMAAHDFSYIFEELNQWIEKEDSNYRGLFDNVKTNHGDTGIGLVIDSLLFAIPKYAVNSEDNSLYPMVKEVAELFISLGADPTITYYKAIYGEHVSNVVLESAKLPNSELLQFFYENKFWDDPKDIKTESDLDTLQFATTGDSAACIEYLVKEQGFDVNARYFFSNDATPIFFAVGRKCENAFDKLIELGADIKLIDYYGCNPVSYLATEDFQFDEKYENAPEKKEEWINFSKKVTDVYNQTPEKEKVKKVRRLSF